MIHMAMFTPARVKEYVGPRLLEITMVDYCQFSCSHVWTFEYLRPDMLSLNVDDCSDDRKSRMSLRESDLA